MAQATQTKGAIGEILLAGTILEEKFASFIQAYNNNFSPSTSPDVPTLILLEEQPRRVIEQEARQSLLHFALFDPNFDFTPYTSGRIFHPLGELRWERQYPKVQIVYTGHKKYRPKLPDARETTLDAYIPIDRRYPQLATLADAERVRLVVCEYVDSTTAVNVAYRLKDLVPFPEQSEKTGANRT